MSQKLQSDGILHPHVGSCSFALHWRHIDHPLEMPNSWLAENRADLRWTRPVRHRFWTGSDLYNKAWENAGKMRRRRVLSLKIVELIRIKRGINDMLRGIQPIWHRLKPGSTGILGLPGAAVDLTFNIYEVIGFVRHSEEKAKAQATNLRPDTKALSAAIASSGSVKTPKMRR